MIYSIMYIQQDILLYILHIILHKKYTYITT